MRLCSILLLLALATTTVAGSAASAEEEERDFYRHHFSLFGGGTRNVDHNKTYGTYGADYVYRFGWDRGRLGLSAFTEIIFEEYTEWILGFPAYLYLTPSLWLRAGPGVEFVKEEKGGEGQVEGASDQEPESADAEREAVFLFRVGVGYVFELGRGFSLTPSIDFDAVRDNESLVFGMAIGRGF